MEEKNQTPYPLAPVANGHSRGDEESATAAAQSKDLKKKKRIKCIGYVLAFAVFQTGIVLLFALTVMRIKNPKFRIGTASLPDRTTGFGTESAPSFNLKMNTQFTVKNTNFGDFKYETGTVTFAYRGATVGQVTVEKARAGLRSTKKVDMVVELNSSNGSVNAGDLGKDIGQGVVPLSSYAKLDGKIHLLMVIKKKKSAQMSCTMELVIATSTMRNIMCK